MRRNPDITPVGKSEGLQYIQIAYARARPLLNRKPFVDFSHGGLRLMAWRTHDTIVWLGIEPGSSCPAHAGGVLLKQPRGWRVSVAGVMQDFQGRGIYPALLKALLHALPKSQEISTAEFFSEGARKSWAKLGAYAVGNRLVLRRNPDQPWTKIGEWWIDDSGTALYADQDVGDMGHEAYVIDSLTRRLLDACGIDCNDEHCDFHSYEDNIKAIMKEEEFEGDLDDFIEQAAASKWKDPNQRKDVLAIVFDDSSGDARKYGMQYDGWIRVAGHGFECWELTPKVLKHMGDGVYDAGIEDIGDDEIFEIYVHKTGMHYTDVPWSVISEGDPGALRIYGTKNNPAPHAPVMSYAAAHRWEALAKSKGVSQVARSERGFMRAYQRAETWAKLDPWWKARRNAFVARHMAQGRHEKLWKPTKSGGLTPSRRALALLMWAYYPPKK